LDGTDLSRERPLSNGVTEACLNDTKNSSKDVKKNILEEFWTHPNIVGREDTGVDRSSWRKAAAAQCVLLHGKN